MSSVYELVIAIGPKKLLYIETNKGINRLRHKTIVAVLISPKRAAYTRPINVHQVRSVRFLMHITEDGGRI